MYLYQCLLWTVSQNISILGKFPEKCGWQVLRCRQLGSGSRRENSTQNVFSLILICLVLNTINFVHDLSNIAKKKKQIFKRFLCQKFCRLVSGFTQKKAGSDRFRLHNTGVDLCCTYFTTRIQYMVSEYSLWLTWLHGLPLTLNEQSDEIQYLHGHLYSTTINFTFEYWLKFHKFRTLRSIIFAK